MLATGPFTPNEQRLLEGQDRRGQGDEAEKRLWSGILGSREGLAHQMPISLVMYLFPKAGSRHGSQASGRASPLPTAEPQEVLLMGTS